MLRLGGWKISFQLRLAMPAASSSLIDPAIGQLMAATQSLDRERAVLAGQRHGAMWSTFRRTWPTLDADALDAVAGGWAQPRTIRT
jgi:hypothetical protein